MIVLETLAVAFSMFSAAPMPQFAWNEKNMRYALCAFPLVGALCAACWGIIAALPLPGFLRGAALCLAPVAVTGGIHLDGYADTWDARSSHAGAARRQEILADPRCGAFAVIHLCGYFTAYLALCVTLVPTARAVFCAGLGFILSRTLSGWAIAALPLAKDTGLAHTFASAAHRRRVRWILSVLAAALIAALAAVGRWAGAAAAAASLLALGRYAHVARREFGGISGDLAGWFLQTCELWQLAALVACQLAGVAL